MASTKEYLDFVLEQLSGLVKPVPVAVKMMPDAEMEPPYDGAKKMILVDDVDNRQFLCELVESMWEELPKKKEKKLRKSASKT